MLNNKTDKITEIAKIKDAGSLFVGSDDGAYIFENGGPLKYYTESKEPEIVFK